MDRNEIISIIVPVYNIETCIDRCVLSILNQSYPYVEIILVDDGSTDNSSQRCDSWAEKYKTVINGKTVKVIHQNNCGVTAARLAGIKEAIGMWIGFVDGDDEIDDDMLERLQHNLVECNADISFAGYRVTKLDGSLEYYSNSGIKIIKTGLSFFEDQLNGKLDFGLHTKLCKTVIATELVQTEIDTTIKINEDLLFCYYLFSNAKKAVYEDFCPYNYISRRGSASQTWNNNSIWDPIKVRQIIKNNVAGTPIERVAMASLLNVSLNSYHGVLRHEPFNNEARQELLSIIKNNNSAKGYLPKKRAILVDFLLFSPKLYNTIRTIYCRVK